jgi:hypothetical protein
VVDVFGPADADPRHRRAGPAGGGQERAGDGGTEPGSAGQAGLAQAPKLAAPAVPSAPARPAPSQPHGRMPAPAGPGALPSPVGLADSSGAPGAPDGGPAPAASAGAASQPGENQANAAEEPAPAATPANPGAADMPGDGALRAERLAEPGDTILLPFDAQTGAAAFAHAGRAHAVFDTGKAIDLAALAGDPVFGSARITVLGNVTHLVMQIGPGKRLSLHRRKQGWTMTVEPAGSQPDTAPVRLHGGVVAIAMPSAAGSVVMVDEVTGGTLLVGTVRDHGPGVQVPHASPDYALLPSWEGVVSAATSDRVALATAKGGFVLQASPGPPLSSIMTDSSQLALEQAGALTRRFELSPLPLPALRQRLSADIAAAARTPRRARFGPRLRAAQDMLALGMDREAAALLTVSMEDDPAQAGRPDAPALLAMARFLAAGAPQDGKPVPDAALANPALGGSDEVALWRALASPGSMSSAERAAVLAGNWRLLMSYPPPLRARLMPLAANILVQGRQDAAALAVLDSQGATGEAPALAMARAALLRAQGKTGQSLAILDQVAASADRKNGALALRQGIEQRVQAGQLPPARAGAQLLSQIDRWREPAFEIETRLRGAALLVQGGAFREALAQLRTTDALFPEAHDRVHDCEQNAVRALVAAGAGARLEPLDLVALVEENADLVGDRTVAMVLTPLVVDKLVALDLPERAEKLLGTLMDRTSDPEPLAVLGSRLAALRLDARDAAGATAALDRSESTDLPPPIVATRAVQRARALVISGQDDAALHVLAPLQSVDALTLEAGILERLRNWHGAEMALQMLANSQTPRGGALSGAQQDLVLRLAGAAAQAGDTALLHSLQTGDALRLSPGPRRSLFQLLVAQPVQGVADLPRSAREAEAARGLPAALARYDSP